MAPKVKVALSVMSEAVETMCGWAICVVALYAVLFSNFTGNGSLWDSLRGVAQDAMPTRVRDGVSVQLRVVPVRPPDMAAKAQNRMLMIPEAPDKEITVPVVASDEPPQRLPDQITDAPADASVGKDWRPHLTSQLRTFTVYGQGDQHSSASVSARASSGASSSRAGSAAAASIAAAPTPAATGSAYRVGALTGEARPGISDHVTNEDSAGADGMRNFR